MSLIVIQQNWQKQPKQRKITLWLWWSQRWIDSIRYAAFCVCGITLFRNSGKPEPGVHTELYWIVSAVVFGSSFRQLR